MNRRTYLLALLCATALSSEAAIAPIFINDSPVVPPMVPSNINARVWLNRARYEVNTLVPWESQNTRFFTNIASTLVNGIPAGGVMIGDPGFRFFRNTNGQRFQMDAWVNEGTIITDQASFFSTLGNVFFINDSSASILQVGATNITSTGPISSGAHGLVRLEGDNISLVRNGLRTGRSTSSLIGGGFVFFGASNYLNDVGVTDVYWGIGTNGTFNGQGPATRIDGSLFTLPNPSSPTHQVQQRDPAFGQVFTTLASVPGFFGIGTNVFRPTFGGFTAAVFTNSLSPTSSIVQVVFYPTNFVDTNFSVDVRFAGVLGPPGVDEPATVVVAFNSLDYDIIDQAPAINSVYLIDGMAVQANSFLARNFTPPNTRRPGTYEVIRTAPFEYFSGIASNAAFTSNLIYRPSMQFASVTNRYAAYAAQIDLLSTSASGSIPYDPTNMPGRIDIFGNQVNLDQVRIRAESAVNIKANNLTSNRLAQVDAPFVNFDGRSVHPELVISNLAPATVRRMNGVIRAWSGQWRNFEGVPTGTNFTTNAITYHVLIVDPQLQTDRPVLVNEFAARAQNIVIKDLLNIGKSFLVQGTSWHLTGGLNLPSGVSLAANNMIGLLNFTNDGSINISGSEKFGTDRTNGYLNYVNRGTNIAGAHFIRTENFDNSGIIIANGGPFVLDAVNASLLGNPLIETPALVTNFFGTNIFVFTNLIVTQVGPKIEGVSEVRIDSQVLVTSNATINAGTLYVDVSGQLTDSGTNAINRWNVTGGFRVNTLPATSDLFGTYVRSTTARLGLADHYWAGEDFDATTAGYANNLALGSLTLNGGSNSLFRFFGATGNNALYVDYLELLGAAVDVNQLLSIDPSLTIYFANANVPASRLDGAANGRIRWVPQFAGPLSSTNMTYSSGSNYTFNIALVTDLDLDSDGDGIVNGLDPEPILVSEMVVLNVNLASVPLRAAELKWRALAYSRNIVEFKSSAGASAWQVLTNFVKNEFTTPVSVLDPLTTNGSTRVYRLKVEPQH